MKVALVTLLSVLALAVARPSQAIECDQVNAVLKPCLGYLIFGGVPSTECCGGVRELVSLCDSTAAKQKACTCVKEVAVTIPGIKDANAAALADKCQVKIDVIVARNTDCSSIH